MIPRVLHQVWVGPRKMPAQMRLWADTWRQHHPEWELCLWSDEPQRHDGSPYTMIRPLPALLNGGLIQRVVAIVGHRSRWAAISDMARIEIIAREGGVYMDTDVECFAPIDPLLANVRLFIAEEWTGSPGNYLFGAEPNHPALWRAVRELVSTVQASETPKVDYYLGRLRVPGRITRRRLAAPLRALCYRVERREHRNAVFIAGPNYLNPRLREHPDCVVFHQRLFNPLSPWEDHAQVTSWPEESFGNHHYAGTWYDRQKGPPSEEFLRGSEA